MKVNALRFAQGSWRSVCHTAGTGLACSILLCSAAMAQPASGPVSVPVPQALPAAVPVPQAAPAKAPDLRSIVRQGPQSAVGATPSQRHLNEQQRTELRRQLTRDLRAQNAPAETVRP